MFPNPSIGGSLGILRGRLSSFSVMSVSSFFWLTETSRWLTNGSLWTLTKAHGSPVKHLENEVPALATNNAIHTLRLFTCNLWKANRPLNIEDSGIVMLAKDLQSANARSPMAVTDSGIVMLAKDLQPAKAPVPMAVTDLGIVMLAKDLQPAKAPVPMAVTDLGIVMLAKDSHPAKA